MFCDSCSFKRALILFSSTTNSSAHTWLWYWCKTAVRAIAGVPRWTRADVSRLGSCTLAFIYPCTGRVRMVLMLASIVWNCSGSLLKPISVSTIDWLISWKRKTKTKRISETRSFLFPTQKCRIRLKEGKNGFWVLQRIWVGISRGNRCHATST